MTIDDPWKELVAPETTDALSARRVDASMPWGFFWARGADRRHLLLLRHDGKASPAGRLPRLKGIETTLSEQEADGSRLLALRLLDPAQRDIFHRLCLDIIASTARASSEAEAVAHALARTWRWHHLLRGGADGRLSIEEQKGLIGELLVLDELLLPVIPVIDALTAWRGPLGAPKDFEVGRVCIEAKARRGAATPHVAISSEYQLSTEGTDALYLHVAELSQAPADAPNAFCLTDVAMRLQSRIASADSVAEDLFESLVVASGFSWSDNYSDFQFVAGPSRIYGVAEGFPAITPALLTPAISHVRYSIALSDCEPFRVISDAVHLAIGGSMHGS